MYLFTYSDLVTKLGNDLDITDENFVSTAELMGYINEGIDDAQAAIHNLNYEDKYFLVPSTFSWISGTPDYTLPTDIYANKIRMVFYDNGADQYEITRIKNLQDTISVSPTDPYRYLIINNVAGALPKARFYPTPAEMSSNAVLWYVREMMKVTVANQSTFKCEVPECQNFIFSHAKWNVMKKTRRADLIADAKTARDEQYINMLQNLQQMVLDEDNLIQQDLGFYNQGCWRG